ncbi:uncharacterized protein SAPINGB_P005978 [Magnusiomyces paraingens]|uniref:Ras GEF n=1 Tax=Magnusiomyces paraingens TaxID=2606893 RepID=A0A5E8C3R1_9ASCO|nr:uncharacterized protein SAPINGB_P005978 [Saprochaete ingens]VVT57982.1 unnamed protein product [Saprochaete ingens]
MDSSSAAFKAAADTTAATTATTANTATSTASAATAAGPAAVHSSTSSTYIPGFSCFSPPVLTSSSTSDFDFSSSAPSVIRTRRASLIPVLSSPSPGPSPSPTSLSPVSPVSPMAHLTVSPPYHYSFHQYHPNSSTGSAGFAGTSPYPSSNISSVKVARRCVSTTSLVKSPPSSASASSLATLKAPNSANHKPFQHSSPTASTARSTSNTALMSPSEEPSVDATTAISDSLSKQPVLSSASHPYSSSSSSSSFSSSNIPRSRPHHLLMSHSSTSSLAGRHSTLDPAVVGTAPAAISTASTPGHSDSRLTRHHSFLRSRISGSLKRSNGSSTVTTATSPTSANTNATSSVAIFPSTKQTPTQGTSFAIRGEHKRQLKVPSSSSPKTSPKHSPQTSPKPPTDRHSSSSSSTRSSNRSSGSSSTYTSSSSSGKTMPTTSMSSSMASSSASSQQASQTQHLSTNSSSPNNSTANNPDQNAFDLSSFQESTSGYPFLRALHSFDASTLFSGQSDDDPSSICLSFQESEIVLLHSIHPSGWGDATILSNAARGWIPTNYFTPYSDPKIVPVLSAVLNFVLAPKSHPLPRPSSRQQQNQALDSPQEPRYSFPPAAISAIVAGVRSLLEACGTLTRDTPIVRRSQSIRKFRKILLAELAILVSLAKQYKYTTDDANIERLVTGSYKIIFRAVIFLDIWTLDRGSTANSISSEPNSENVTPTSTKTEPSKDERPVSTATSATESHSPGVTLSTAKPESTITKSESQKRMESLKKPAPSIDNIRSTFEDFKPTTEIESIKEVDVPADSASSTSRTIDPRELSAAPSPVPAIIPPRRSLVPNRESMIFHEVPPSALQRLEEVHDALTSYLGNFLHQRLSSDAISGAPLALDANSSACTQILVNTRKSMLACRELLAAVESISSHSLPRNKDLEKRKEKLFSQIRQLVSVARDVVASTPATAEAQEDDDEDYNDEEDENDRTNTSTSSDVPDEISPRRKARMAKLAYAVESRRLVESAAICARTSDECVSMCRLILDRIGDFQLSPTREYPDFSDGLIAETPTELEHKAEATSMPTTAIVSPEKTSVSSTISSAVKSLSSLSLSHRHTPSTTSTITDAVSAPQTTTTTTVSSTAGPNSSAMSSKATLFPSTNDSKMSPLLPDIPTILPLLSDQFDDPPMHSPNSGAFPYPQPEQGHPNSISNNNNNNANANANANANTKSSNNNNSSLGHTLATSVAGPSTSFSANTTAPLPTDLGTVSPASRQPSHLQQSPQASTIPAVISNESDAQVRAAIAALPADERVLREVGTSRIRGASLPALVKVLTDNTTPEDPDAHLLSTFFLTFRQFTTPLDLANALITRFQSSTQNKNDPDEDLNTQIRQAKVYNLLKRWMESYWKQSTDAPALPRIVAFANASLFNSVGGYYSSYALSKSVLTDLAAKIPHLPDGEPLVPRPIIVPGADEARRLALTYSTTPLIPVHLSRHQVALLAKAVDAQESIAAPSSVKEVTSDDGRVGSVTANAWNRMIRASSSDAGSDAAAATAAASGATYASSSLSHPEPYGATAHTIVLFLDIDTAELAKQITLLDSGLLCRIQPEELLDQNFTLKRRSLGLAPNVSAMTLLTNQLSFFVGDTILNPDISTKTRQRVLKHWIKTAEKCHELSSFNALMTIVSALQSVNVVRLRKTWAEISPRHANTLASLKTLLSMDKNYSAYRAALRAAPLPRVPYLGLYLTDLTFVGEGNHPLRSLTIDTSTHEVVPAVAARRAPQGAQPQGTGPVQPAPPPSFAVINFDRYDRITRIIGDLQCQQVPYRVAPCPELQAWLRMEMARSYAVVSKDHNGLWRRSMIIEPKQ